MQSEFDSDAYDTDEGESVFKRSIANGRQRPSISPPLQEIRQVPRVSRSRGKSDDEEEEAMDQGGEKAPGSPQEVDLLHFAPMYVQKTDDLPEPIRMSNVRLRRNENFRGDWKEEMGGIDSDHYKSNNHFDWTNQLVVGRGVEVDAEENSICNYLRANRSVNNPQNPQVQRFPENHFRLKKVEFGYGLFAKGLISKGTVVGEYTGELITKEEQRWRWGIYKAHNMSNYNYDTRKPGLVIDAGPMGNHTRFINHDCDKENCDGFWEVIDGVPKNWVVAMREIKVGEELFINYGAEYFRDLTCLCGGDNCVEIEKRRRRLEEENEEDE